MKVPFTDEGSLRPIENSGEHKGGMVTLPLILANGAFETVACNGLLPNMILYLMKDYNTGVRRGTSIIFFWSAATNFMPVVVAFLSDSCLGRFRTISIDCLFSFTGMVLLWLTTIIPQAKSSSCDQSMESCKSATPGQYAFLISALAFISIGATCSVAFGADQIDNRVNPKNGRILERFFGWHYASVSTALLIAFTGIVYIQDHLGCRLGFGVPAILMFFSALLFFAPSLYLKVIVKKSVLTSVVQVPLVAFKNRKLALPKRTDLWYPLKDSEVTMPTEKLRFLNKACIIRNPEDVCKDGVASNPWSVCTVDQDEELKALIRVIPLWSSSIMMSINITSQSTFQVLQASSMDRHLTPSFQIPAGSFVLFVVVTIMIWIGLYDRVIIPTASKLKGKPVHLSVKHRIGLGQLFSGIGMVVSAIVENVRRRKAIEQMFLDNPRAVINMSAMWLVPQLCINGLSQAFNGIGQTEFYYSEFPKSMSSIASALFFLGPFVANLLASVILNAVQSITKGEGR